MIRRISTVLLSLCLLLVVVSCAQGGGFSKNPAMVMVGVSMTIQDKAAGTGEAVQAKLEEAGHTVELAYATSAQEQNEQIAALVKDGAAVLVISPLNSLEVEQMLDSGKTDVSDVTVIACGAPVASDCVKAYVGPDLYESARQQANRAVKELGLEQPGSGTYQGRAYTVELVAGNGARRCIEGAMEVLQPYVDAGMITLPSGTEQETCYQEDPAQYVERLCKSRYASQELGALLCLGEGQAEPVIRALMSSYSGAAFPVVTGYGCNEESVQYLAAHLLSMVAYCEDQDPASLTERAMDAAAASAEEVQNTASPCTVVTSETYEKLLVDTGLYTAHKGGTFTKN